ncbi:hypothetical protein [Streptomyces synnematoformans]
MADGPLPGGDLYGEGGVSAERIVPIPQWCLDHAFEGTRITRTKACDITATTFTTYRIVNNVRQVTGVAHLTIVNYAYSSETEPNWIHQFEIAATAASWGDARNAVVSGKASGLGECQLDCAGR